MITIIDIICIVKIQQKLLQSIEMYLFVFFQTDVLPFSYRLGGLKRLHESFSS